jgi:hypothetical protein
MEGRLETGLKHPASTRTTRRAARPPNKRFTIFIENSFGENSRTGGKRGGYPNLNQPG